MSFLKKAGITAGVLAAAVYISIVFILPNALNLNSFKDKIQKTVQEQADLNVDFNDAKLTVTPALSIGVKAEGITAKLPDGSELFSASKIHGAVSLPHLLFKTIKVTKAEAVSPKINIDIAEGKEYKIVKHFENLSAANTGAEELPAEGAAADTGAAAGIKIDVPQAFISNYAVLINDLKTNDVLKLKGDELLISYKDGETASIKTIAELFLNEKQNITADIDIDTVIPHPAEGSAEKPEAKEEEKQQETQFINPAALYKTYDLKADIASKLKIREKNGKIVSYGYFNIDKLSLVLSGVKLPESMVHLTSAEAKINSEAELYLTEEEKISVKAEGDYGSKPYFDVKIKSNEIHAENVLELAKAALYSADIKNDLNLYKGSGSFTADADIKTDFKTLNSNGSVIFKDILIRDAAKNTKIAEINSSLLLDNNVLKITDTVIKAFDAVFKAEGSINEKSYADIKLTMDRMPLEKAFALFLPAEMRRQYTVNSGAIDLSADIKGEIAKPEAKAKFQLANLSIKDKINGINYFNNLLTADFDSDFKTFKGVINNSDFSLSMNGASVTCGKLSINAGDKDLVINPAVIKVNNTTNVNVKGTVKDYITNPIFNIKADGSLKTADLKQLAGSDAAVYIKEKGVLPFSADISGDSRVQTVSASVSADAGNYITFADIKSLLNKKSVLEVNAEIKDNKVTIKDTGLYAQNGGSKKAYALVEGVISRLDTPNPVINTLKIQLPENLEASLAVFPQSKFTVSGDAALSGSLNNPKIRGGFYVSNASIPELAVTLENAAAKFEDKNLDIELKKLTADGSDLNIVINSDLTPSKYFIIKNLNLISDYIDADKISKVSEKFAEYTAPKTAGSISAASSAANNSGAAADIPVIIKDGSIDIKEIKSGNIHLTETAGKISLAKNIFYINNLISSAFKGRMKGGISMNLITSEIAADIKGSGMDAAQALLEAAAMKDTLSGALDFDADVSLKGASYEEQVKSLKGSVNFYIKDGSLGPLGKLENLVSADNLTSSSAVRTLVNTALSSTVDTSRFSSLNGSLNFDKGIARINPITSSGDYMSTYIFGTFDILKNTADMKLRGRLGSRVTESMGQLAALNPVNVIKSSSGMNLILGKLMLTLCEKVTDDELKQIPPIAKETSDENTAKFQAVIRGDAAKPAKLIRSFKWLASESQIKEAEAKLSISAPLSVPSNLNEAKQQAKDILKNLSSEGTQELQQQGKEAVNALKSIFNAVKNAPEQKE